MVALALFILFIVLPIAEIFVIIEVGSQIGVLPTVALLVADAVVGVWLLRTQGRGAWILLNKAIQERRVPAREVADGGLIMFGGVLLLTPGFITDILAILMILPPTRAIMRTALSRTLFAHLTVTVAGVSKSRRGPGPEPYDVEGTAVEIDTPSLPR
ncbi:MAG: FxsA family protein [Solirubrobacterales bacterium]|nr:FxsA family protein [Solirubrobacterales bacterium]